MTMLFRSMPGYFTYIFLGMLLCLSIADARRRSSRYRNYQSDGTGVPNLKGANVCGGSNVRRCCRGWNVPAGGRRCILPQCSGGCGSGGMCMRPGLCLCVSGQISPYCNDKNGGGGGGGTSSLCNPKCLNGGVCVGRNLCRCPSGFSGGNCVNDLRTGPCYTQLSNNMCRGQLTGVSCTKHLCCSTIGMAWGDPCEQCPANPHPCRRGYIPNLKKNTCQDIDECKAIPGLCVSGGCINTVGSYVCQCQDGQRTNPATGTCEDVNECITQRDICGTGGSCTNTEGSYFCTCRDGYELTSDRSRCILVQRNYCFTRVTGGRCSDELSTLTSLQDCCCGLGKGWGDKDLCQLCPLQNSEAFVRLCQNPEPSGTRDECAYFGNLCKNGRCVDTTYSYRCECYQGFRLGEAGTECVDIDECTIQTGLCLNGVCNNIPGSYECQCNDGYVLASNGRYCTDMNECKKTNMCPNGKCLNMNGSYKCQCNRGYKQSSNQQICTDINECTENGRLCHNGQCRNSPGSYRCVCNPGYRLSPDGAFCLDYNECETSGMCSNGMCRNMDGSYKCICSPGYRLAPSNDICIDVDECVNQPGVCVNGQCINNQGSFRCECPKGFTLGPDRRTCLDTRRDLCFMRYGRGVCSSPSPLLTTKSQCCCNVDTMDASGIAWGAACEECPSMSNPEFKILCPHGTGTDHEGGDINQCALMPDICENGGCENTRRGYRCICHQGYKTDSSRKRCIDIDECSENRYCEGGQCRNTPGSFKCICPPGSRLNINNQMCEDIDECATAPCIGGNCINVVGSFRCECPPGFLLDNARRICLDERKGACWMKIRNGQCEENVKRQMLKAECCSTIGKAWGSPCEKCSASVSSQCPVGFLFRGDGCQDINECVLFPGICRGGTCVNTEGSFTCTCPLGTQLDSTGRSCVDKRKSTCYLDYSRGSCSYGIDGLFTRAMCCCSVGKAWNQNCEPCPPRGSDNFKELCPGGGGKNPDPDRPTDINECRLIPGICTNGQCRNTQGSYTCICNPGFALDSRGFNCTDIDECRISFGICRDGACVNTPGAFRCVCNEGYTAVMMEQMCMDMNECEDDRSLCRGGSCINEPGSYRCDCPVGLELSEDGRRCVDIDECSDSNSICSNGYCENFMGGYQCRCLEGFRQNAQKTSCIDIDECSERNGGCMSLCINSPGSFTCACEIGFTLQLDGRSCLDYNECKEIDDVCNGGKCQNTPGGYRCTCVGGLRPSDDMKQCLDIDECIENRNLCFDGRCENTHGSYTCVCDPGYGVQEVGYNPRCIDIDECKTGDNVCDINAVCINTEGSYKCDCAPGYSGDGYTCRDNNECQRQGVCSPDAGCMNKPGSFSCICKDGFTGDGFTCRDVDECRLNPNLCENGQCYNYPGGYRCTCDMGFATTEDETACVDIDECFEFQQLCSNGRCKNSIGGFICNCKQGYKVDETGQNCTDINECDNPENCVYGRCINNRGGYICQCPPNYELNSAGNGCIDLRSGFCYLNVRRQSRDGTCSVVIGREVPMSACCCSIGKGWGQRQGYCDVCPVNGTRDYKTLCPADEGFKPNPETLLPEDIDECRELPNICIDGDCQNTFGSYVCVCPNGYSLNLRSQRCEDINECDEYPDYCGLGTCVNSQGSFSCLCPDGYMPMAGEGCMDMRKDICYAALFNSSNPRLPPRCEHQLATNVTKRQCCCRGNVGEGWGTPCEACPGKNTVEYLELCKPLPIKETENECALYQFLCENGRCIDTNTDEGFLCECGLGFVYNPVSKRCDDEDECRGGSNPCRGHSICINSVGSYRCECVPGYKLRGRNCVDINECEEVAGICTNGDCVNHGGSFSCLCKAGFRLAPSRDACLDVNECELQPGLCRNGTCDNKIGGYNCNCATGFTLTVNDDCEDINECRDFIGICINGRCRNTAGSFYCECLPGYSLSSDGMNCGDIDECSDISGLCRNGMCSNTEGSYQCTCFKGYRLSSNGERCIDINECASSTGLCSNGRCYNEPGSFRCVCPPEYVLTDDGRDCIDFRHGNCFRAFERGICLEPRPVNMTKTQCCCTSGAAWSYSSSDLCEVCPIKGEAGFKSLCADIGRGNGPSGDEDLDECMLDPDLCLNGRCVNTDGSFRCECQPGYVVDSSGPICVDDNECLNRNICGDGTCTNTIGSFRCDCREGFAPGPDEVCDDINECEGPLNQCAFRCANIRGSFKCICPSGYQVAADGIHCEDVDECSTPVNQCRYACKNLIGTFMCICPEGYTETGRDQCVDIDECRANADLCNPGRCLNVQGSYRCDCPRGYHTSTDGTQCLDRREDYCYAELTSRRCIPTSSTSRSTRNRCCCTGGVAWGRTCQNCPAQGTAAYKRMCPAGEGYDKDGKDIDECRIYSNLCTNGRCLNTMGSYRCVCDNGFKTDGSGNLCIDVDECLSGQSGCEGICQNLIGSFKCACTAGYILNTDARTCRDIDECKTGRHNCPHECINTDGGFECGCNKGYRQGRNKQCIDINECSEQSYLCTPGGRCQNIPGGYKCICNRGYKLDQTGEKCIDINECDGSQCETMCENSPGGFLCGCPEGFQEYWGQCVEIDVCVSSPCLFDCVPTGQEFMCGCPPGYQMMGQGHCIQTISPADYGNMFPPGVELPHETGKGTGELPDGEGCYSCNVGDSKLEVPLTKRNKRSAAEGFVEIVKGDEEVEEWLDDETEQTFEALLKSTGDIQLTDIQMHGHKFTPKILRSIVKREARVQKGNQVRRHRTTDRHLHDTMNSSSTNGNQAVPVVLNISDVQRKTKLVKIVPALSVLKGNVVYKITNRKDKLFYLRDRNGINSLHAKRKKLREGMSYLVDIEGVPIDVEASVSGHEYHLQRSTLRFFVYIL